MLPRREENFPAPPRGSSVANPAFEWRRVYLVILPSELHNLDSVVYLIDEATQS